MATSMCPECGQPVPNAAMACAACGRPTSTPPTTSIAPPRGGRSVTGFVAFGAALLGVFVVYYWWTQ
jgi:hypothetical protein